MATLYEDALQRVRDASDKLARLHADPAVALNQLTAALSEYRRACTSAVHADYADACNRKIELDLWEAHSKINGLFRKHMHALKKGGRRNAVEIRKETKLYLEFLKLSQRFYRNFICELDHYRGGIAELRKVAGIIEPQQIQAKADSSPARDNIQKRLVQSCYDTLIHLGDLSRYRETECSRDAPNWGPAVGFYDLATDIFPDSGISHNQLAVIALHDQSHVRSLYHLYRAITVQQPHPRGKANLEIEFKKVTAAWDKGELINVARARDRDGSSTTKALSAWYVRLHSKCFQGEKFSGHGELENEVIGQLKTALQDRDRDHSALLHKFVLINISAEWLIMKQIEGGRQSTRNRQSFYFYLQFNARTFGLLLQVLLEELEGTVPNEFETFELSPTARRCMPAIRLYSCWLSANAQVLSAELDDPSTMTRLKEMWRLYAALLTKAAPLVSRQDLHVVNYMLEEDVDTIGFLPLFKENIGNVWHIGDQLKPRFSDEAVERHLPAAEALGRLRDLVIAGTQSISSKSFPITYQNWRFAFKEDYDLATDFSIQTELTPLVRSTVEADAAHAQLAPAQLPSIATSDAAKGDQPNPVPGSCDAMMNRMVDALVGDDSLGALLEDEEGPVTPPANALVDSPMIRDLSNSIGALSATDMGSQFPPQSEGRKSSTLNANASPFIRAMPSPQDAVWSRQTVGSDPSTPFQVAAGLHRGSPLLYTPEMSSAWHSRQVSDRPSPSTSQMLSVVTSSGRSNHSGTPIPTMPSAFGSLGDIWGVSSAVPTAEWVRQKQPRYQDAPTNSMLFGKRDDGWDAVPKMAPIGQATSPTHRQGG